MTGKRHASPDQDASSDGASTPASVASAQGTGDKPLAESPAQPQQHVGAQELAAAAVPAPPAAMQAAHPASPADASSASQQASPAPLPSASTEQASTPQLSSAQLLQSMHHTEMKVGVQSAEFGNISINTTLTRQTLSAQISTEHAGLGQALAAHLTGIEEKLGNAYGVPARVSVQDGKDSATADGGAAGQREQAQAQAQSQSQGQGQNRPRDGRNGFNSSSLPTVESAHGLASLPSAVATAGSTRLDVRI